MAAAASRAVIERFDAVVNRQALSRLGQLRTRTGATMRWRLPTELALSTTTAAC